MPLWICYFDNNIIDESNRRSKNVYNNDLIHLKQKFCSFIAGGPGLTNNRKEFVEKLSKYKRVDCGGAYLNNLGYTVPRGTDCSGKIEHNLNYKFIIAFESKDYPGYVTEKICDVYKSNCIPIYWGNKEVIEDFNPKTFINANNFSNFDELVEYIIKVDNDDELYASYFKEPILSHKWMNVFNDPNSIYFKNLSNKIIGNKTKLLDDYFNTRDIQQVSCNSKKYKLSVCLLIKNETENLNDWLKHYINQGVEHFFITSNNSTDGIDIFIENSEYKNMITLIIDNRDLNIYANSSHHSMILCDNFYNIIKVSTEWCILVDIDEFMYGKNGFTLSSFIDTLDEDIGCFYVYWNIFKPTLDSENNISDHFSLEKSAKRINLDLITKLSYEIQFASKFGKSIFRTSMTDDDTQLWIHKVPTSGKIINNYNTETNYIYDNDDVFIWSEENYNKLNIVLNHYPIRNKSDYNKKIQQLENNHRYSFITGIVEIANLDNSFLIDDYSLCK